METGVGYSMSKSDVFIKKVHLVWRFVTAFAILLIAAKPKQVSAQPPVTDSDPVIQKYRQLIPQLMSEQDIPGLAVAVVDDQGILWVEGFGFTDDDHKTVITPDTIFSVQSTSKNFTAAAVLLAVQDGILDLDTPITAYLPDFTVHSIFEEQPERKITLRMLLSHTAGFAHEAPTGNNYDMVPVAFGDHIRSISDTWLRFPVGTGYAYSNLGISLAGYILQTVSGQPFPKYVEEKLLHPLGMDNSSFDMDQIRANSDRAIGHSRPLPRVPLEIPLVPEGGLYTSANDMAKYIQFHLNLGTFNGQSLLSPGLLDEMYTVPAPAQGSLEGYALGVYRAQWHRGREAVLFWHGGGGFGFLSDLWWLPELKIGITILTNSTSHQLQGELALDILNDFVHDPARIYYARLMALPSRTPVVDGDGGYRPPIGLAQAIERYAIQHSDEDRLRWSKYIGTYGAITWGVLDPINPTVQIYQLGSHLYIEPRDSTKNLKLTEVSPGLFFAENGEALDFRGDIPTWRNIKLTKMGVGPAPWQWMVLALCALVFLTGLLFIPLRGLIHRFHHTALPTKPPSPWRVLTSALVTLTSIFGLLSIAMIVAIPRIIYSGFLGWLNLPLWLRLVMHMPFAFLVAGIGFLVLNVPGWKYQWWSPGERTPFLVFDLASIVMIIFLGYWHLIGLG